MWLSHMRHYHMDPPGLSLTLTFEQTTWAKFHIQKTFFFFLFFAVHLFVVIRDSTNSITNSTSIVGRESIEVTFGAPHTLSLLLYDIVIYYRAQFALNATAAVAAAATVCRHITRWTFASASAFICLLCMQEKSDDSTKSQLSTVEIDDWLSVCLSLSWNC